MPRNKSSKIVLKSRAVTQSKSKAGHTVEAASIPSYDVADEDWQKIAATTPLPSDARVKIAAAISGYHSEMLSLRTSLTTKRQIHQMRGHLEKLTALTTDLAADKVYYGVGIPWWSSIPRPKRNDLELVIKQLRGFNEALASAQERMVVKRGRKPSEPLRRMIKFLVWVQADATKAYVKRSIKTGAASRPHNKFIQLCARIADEKIPRSRVDAALKSCIAEYHQNLKSEGFNIATGERSSESRGNSTKSRRITRHR